jgi:hypothetical protein
MTGLALPGMHIIQNYGARKRAFWHKSLPLRFNIIESYLPKELGIANALKQQTRVPSD